MITRLTWLLIGVVSAPFAVLLLVQLYLLYLHVYSTIDCFIRGCGA